MVTWRRHQGHCLIVNEIGMFTVTQPPDGGGKLWARNPASAQDLISFEFRASFVIEAVQTRPSRPTRTLTVKEPETSAVRSAVL